MKRLATLAALAVAIVTFAASPARAASPVVIRQVDTTGWPTVRLMVQADAGNSPIAFNVRDGDRLVNDLSVIPLGQSNAAVGTVLVIDASGSMSSGGRIEAARAAARQFVSRMLPKEQVALVAFGEEPRVVMPFTADKAALQKAIDAIQPHGETALWDAVAGAAALFQDRSDLQPNIVVLSDGRDTVSKGSDADARASVLAAKAVVFTIGVGGARDLDAGALSSLAGATGGRFLAAPTAADLGAAYAAIQSSLQAQYELTYQARGTDPRDVTVTVGGERATASAAPGTLSRGVNLRPAKVNPPRAPGFLSGLAGRVLIMGLVLAAAGAAAWAIAMTLSKPQSELAEYLAPYEPDETERLRTEAPAHQGIGDSALLRRAVDTAKHFEAGRALVAWLEAKLEQANVPMRAPEALLLFAGATVIGAPLVFFLLGPVMAFGAVVLLLLAPVAALGFLARRRRTRFTKQLPDALKLLSGTLRAGYSLMQGVETMSAEIGDPMGAEMKRVLAEARLGRGLDEALEDMATRLGSPDFDWTVMAINIQREVGGNLAELLETVADTMTARVRLRREVKALTAEGRMSAIVIGILPVALGALMFMLNPTYMSPLLHTAMGKAMSVGAGLLALVGFYWMKKTVDIEI